MKIELELKQDITRGIAALYQQDIPENLAQPQVTKKEFKGHFTLVVFPFLKMSKKGPEQTADEIGNWLVTNSRLVQEFNVIKGFLNLVLNPSVWIETLEDIAQAECYGIKKQEENAPLVMVEYSSPNTNKPLHMGHLRTILLGYSISNILKANGLKVVKTNMVNDRGIHICKSMLAWVKWGNGETPESSGKKGDHLVGDYYVLFDKNYKAELKELQAKGLTEKEAEAQSSLMSEAREMLRKWEAGDSEIVELWKTMNGWVYAGFDKSYARLGVDFDKVYYESETYIDGKETVQKGLSDGILYQKEDGSIWADLTDSGLDHKLLLRADGTSVYMTQDIGTAKQRFDDYPIDTMVYVVGNEQNYHFQVLALVLDKLGFKFGKDLVHFSYGMIELPEGRMKSREGTVVDADDLMTEMEETAKEMSKELGKLDGMSEAEINEISSMIGLGALKYFILKVDPKKNMIFNPKESIDFNGHTGPFIQYTHARIQSVLRKAKELGLNYSSAISKDADLSEKEEQLIQLLADFAGIVESAGKEYNPASIANYVYDLSKEYNQFYHDFSILKEECDSLRNMRLVLSENVAKVIKTGMNLLGIDVPDKM